MCTLGEVGIIEVGDGTGKAVVFATPMYVGVCGGEGRGIEPNFNYKSCEVVCSGGGGVGVLVQPSLWPSLATSIMWL